MSTMRESASGANLALSINGGGRPLLAQSSRYSEATVDAGARAAYRAMMNGLASYDSATTKMQHKSRQIAIAVLDAARCDP